MSTKKIVPITVLCWIMVAGFLSYFRHTVEKAPHRQKYNVGLLIMATGKYINFIPRLVESAQKNFLTHHNVTYFVFTDSDMALSDPIKKIYQQRLGWPYDTMMRFGVYYKNKDLFASMDYLYALDADMLFVDKVGDEILGDRVATLHPNYLFEARPYETNPLSTACMNRGEGGYYFAGAFYGGKKDIFLELVKTADANITVDLARGVIASVNDESHLNRYLAWHEPTIILNPSYCHFESWDSPYPKKLVAFDKIDHGKSQMRAMKAFNPIEYYVHQIHSLGKDELKV